MHPFCNRIALRARAETKASRRREALRDLLCTGAMVSGRVCVASATGIVAWLLLKLV